MKSNLPIADVISKMHPIPSILYQAIQGLEHLGNICTLIKRVKVKEKRIDIPRALLDENDNTRRGIRDPARLVRRLTEKPGGKSRNVVIRGQRDSPTVIGMVVENGQVVQIQFWHIAERVLVDHGRRVLDVREHVRRAERVLRV